MKSKFTPGPWRVLPRETKSSEVLQIPIADDYGCIAWLVNRPVRVGSDEANAALIAAAPEMLEALLAAETMLILDGHTTRNPLTEESPVLRQIRAAIAKARGEA